METNADDPLKLLESLKTSMHGKSQAELAQMTGNGFSNDAEMYMYFTKKRVANKINDELFEKYDSTNPISALR